MPRPFLCDRQNNLDRTFNINIFTLDVFSSESPTVVYLCKSAYRTLVDVKNKIHLLKF